MDPKASVLPTTPQRLTVRVPFSDFLTEQYVLQLLVFSPTFYVINDLLFVVI